MIGVIIILTYQPESESPAEGDRQEQDMSIKSIFDWIYRLIKGMFIGTGAILPGVSGGALAAVFGLYERIIAFLSNPRRDFWRNVLFFVPVALGALLGMVALSHPLNYFLNTARIQVLWCFVGCIAGTLPALYREAGKEGRQKRHLLITVCTTILGFGLLLTAQNHLNVHLSPNFAIWILAGAIFALGMIVPGLSPSNFLMYFNLYEPMTAGIAGLDLKVILPLGLGAVICVLLFARLMSLIMKRAYAGVFHFILGIVIASTAIIIPRDYSNADLKTYLVSGVVFIAGFLVGLLMNWLDQKYKADQSTDQPINEKEAD